MTLPCGCCEDKDLERFIEATIPGPEDCILWKHYRNEYGYGRFKCNGKTWYAHRWILHAVGRLPMGYDTHHVCKRRSCVHVRHLEIALPIPHRVEHLRGMVRYGVR